MGLDIPNSFLPLFFVALFCAGIAVCEMFLLFGNPAFRNRLFLKGFTSITAALSLAATLYAAPHAFVGPSSADVRFNRLYFTEYRLALLPNMLLGALLVVLVVVASLWIARIHTARPQPESQTERGA